MHAKQLQCGFSLPMLGMGTWGMGGYIEHDPNSPDTEDVAVLKFGLDNGFTHIDTAEIYGGGHAEKLVGAAIAARQRPTLFLTSKVYDHHLDFDGVRQAVEGSLQRLRTDYLDLCLIHHVVEQAPLSETIRGLDQLQDEGMIKNIGVSNFTASRLQEAQTYSRHKIVCNQVHYNLAVRDAEQELLPYCRKHDVMLVAYRPVQAPTILEHPSELLRQIAAKYHRTPIQIAINWLISQANVTSIVAMRTVAQVKENLGATEFTMNEEDIDLLRREFSDRQPNLISLK